MEMEDERSERDKTKEEKRGKRQRGKSPKHKSSSNKEGNDLSCSRVKGDIFAISSGSLMLA